MGRGVNTFDQDKLSMNNLRRFAYLVLLGAAVSTLPASRADHLRKAALSSTAWRAAATLSDTGGVTTTRSGDGDASVESSLDDSTPKEVDQEAAFEKVNALATDAADKKAKLDQALRMHSDQVKVAEKNGVEEALSTQTRTAISASLRKNAEATAALRASETAEATLTKAKSDAGMITGRHNSSAHGSSLCKTKALAFDAKIKLTKEQAAKAQMESDKAKARADAAAQELTAHLAEAKMAAETTHSKTSLEGKSARLARAKNSTEHAQHANEQARVLRETSLKLEDDAADLIVHLKRLESEKATILSTCGKKDEYVARVDQAVLEKKKTKMPVDMTSAAAFLIEVEKKEEILLKGLKEKRNNERVETEAEATDATGSGMGAAGATGATQGATGLPGLIGLTGATGVALGHDGVASLKLMANLTMRADMSSHWGTKVPEEWAEALLKANELRPGMTGATGATGMANGNYTWLFGKKQIDDSFGPDIKNADGKDALTRLEDAGGRYRPSKEVHAKLFADIDTEIGREMKEVQAESKRRAMPPILGFGMQ